MKKKNIILTVLALVLVLASAAENAWAYFTTYTEAVGGYKIRLGSETELKEEVSGLTKTVSIYNSKDSRPVYVRVKAFCGDAYQVDVIEEKSSKKWVKNSDGYYYYNEVLNPDSSTENLVMGVTIPEAEDAQEIDSINIVIIYESTPVQYDENGDPYDPLDEHVDWTIKLQTESEARTGKEAEGSE